MKKWKRIVGGTIFLSISMVCWAGIFGPSNFDDCILESMKGVTSDAAAGVIYESCSKKFPEKQVKRNDRGLKPWELSAITGRGGPAAYSRGYFNLDLLNGNKDITISQVTVVVITKIGGKEVTNFYDQDVSIGPNKTGNVFFKYIEGDNGAKYNWGISAAKGY